MVIPQAFKDAVSFAWNSNRTLRFCCKLLSYPLLGPCYCLSSIEFTGCVANEHGLSRKQLRRYATLADIEHRKRVQRVRKRKRSISVDGKRGRSKNAQDQSQSPLFAKIPVELRLMIYEMILCDQQELAVKFDRGERWDCLHVGVEPGCSMNVLRTCKSIYCEAIPVLYWGNIFKFDSCQVLFTFTSIVPPQRVASIRQIVLDITIFESYYSEFNMRCEKLFTLLGGLRDLRDVCLRYYLKDNDYVSHPCFHDFTLLERLEVDERPRQYLISYEMLEVQEGPKIGGMLFDRWPVGERRTIHMIR